MSTESTLTSTSTTSPLGVRKRTMDQNTYRFRRTVSRSNIFKIVDSYSKWLEVRPVFWTSSSCAIRVLRELFATHGLPDVLVSDNGTAFTSEQFRTFLQNNDIRHAKTTPYHPSSNGQAERYVQMTKENLKKLVQGDWHIKVAKFLVQHITPSATTNKSPAELLIGRGLKTALDRLHPDLVRDIRQKQENEHALQQKTRKRQFRKGDAIFVRNTGTGERWLKGTLRVLQDPFRTRY